MIQYFFMIADNFIQKENYTQLIKINVIIRNALPVMQSLEQYFLRSRSFVIPITFKDFIIMVSFSGHNFSFFALPFYVFFLC